MADVVSPFDQDEEKAIIALMLDDPQSFHPFMDLITIELFSDPVVQYVYATIDNYYKSSKSIISREALRSRIAKSLNVDDDYKTILAVVERKSKIRDIAHLKDLILKWAEHQIYGLIYAPDTVEAYMRKDYESIRKIIERASKLASLSAPGFWLFKQFREIYDETKVVHISTGFPKLNHYLNDGGPSPGEVLVWVSPTGTGKSILLCNNAITCAKAGHNVLYLTFELSTIKTASRMIGALTKINLKDQRDKQNDILSSINSNNLESQVVIYDLPPGECSVSHIYNIVEHLKKAENWTPSVIVIDYLELMVSREKLSKQDDYTIQKHVATEVRGLAKNTNTLIFTATQSNRSSNSSDEGNIDLTKLAESYGKSMPMDYVISINQSEEERTKVPATCRFYIAKNRNGEKFKTIDAVITYANMWVQERH